MTKYVHLKLINKYNLFVFLLNIRNIALIYRNYDTKQNHSSTIIDFFVYIIELPYYWISTLNPLKSP